MDRHDVPALRLGDKKYFVEARSKRRGAILVKNSEPVCLFVRPFTGTKTVRHRVGSSSMRRPRGIRRTDHEPG
jgi:hypothetical protein